VGMTPSATITYVMGAASHPSHHSHPDLCAHARRVATWSGSWHAEPAYTTTVHTVYQFTVSHVFLSAACADT
jgi:hypothetical protein